MIRFKLNDQMYCITAEDITNHPHAMNDVVYNFTLSPKRRIEIFVEKMKKITKHIFTKDELDTIITYDNPCNARQLIDYIRNIIYPSNAQQRF